MASGALATAACSAEASGATWMGAGVVARVDARASEPSCARGACTTEGAMAPAARACICAALKPGGGGSNGSLDAAAGRAVAEMAVEVEPVADGVRIEAADTRAESGDEVATVGAAPDAAWLTGGCVIEGALSGSVDACKVGVSNGAGFRAGGATRR